MTDDNKTIMESVDVSEKILALLLELGFAGNHREPVLLKALAMTLVISAGKAMKRNPKELASFITHDHADDLVVHTAFALVGSVARCPIEQWQDIVSVILTDLIICRVEEDKSNATDVYALVKTVIDASFCVMAYVNGVDAKNAASVSIANADSIASQMRRLIEDAKAAQASKN